MIPWWGWLLISLGSLFVLYWLFTVVFAGIIFTFLRDMFDE